ncbi:MAG: hypothetical protein U0232_03510 [Thermomicrobiales bacterium]
MLSDTTLTPADELLAGLPPEWADASAARADLSGAAGAIGEVVVSLDDDPTGCRRSTASAR